MRNPYTHTLAEKQSKSGTLTRGDDHPSGALAGQ